MFAFSVPEVHARTNSSGFSFDSVIVDAVDKNQRNIVESLLSEGVNPDEQGKFDTTSLHRAAFKGYSDISSTLIDKGASVNARDFGGATPLHMASRKGNIDIVRQLIASGADLDAQDNEGFTPVHRAIANDNTAVAIFLLEAGAAVDSVDSSGNTLLIEAVRRGNAKVAEELILLGADRGRKNDLGISATEYAVKKNDPGLSDVLSKNSSQIKRQRALRGNNVIVVSENELLRNDVPEFIQNRIPARDNIDPLRYSPPSVNEIPDSQLPWLRKGGLERTSYSSTDIKPIPVARANRIMETTPDIGLKQPNMPVVKTHDVMVEDHEITEEQIADILSEDTPSDISFFRSEKGNRNEFKLSSASGVNAGNKNREIRTTPVDGLKVIRERELRSEEREVESNIESNIVDLSSDDKYDKWKDATPSIGMRKTGMPKFSNNEVDYSGYDLNSLPASLRAKYLLAMSPEQRLAFAGVEPKSVSDPKVSVKSVEITSNEFTSLSSASGNLPRTASIPRIKAPVVTVERVNEEPLFLQKERKMKVAQSKDLVDKGIDEILSSRVERKNYPDVTNTGTGKFDRNGLINNIRTFYNGEKELSGGFEEAPQMSSSASDTSVASDNKFISKSGKTTFLNDFDPYKAGMRTKAPSQVSSNNFGSNVSSSPNLPKSQIYKKALAERAEVDLPSSIAYSKVDVGNYSAGLSDETEYVYKKAPDNIKSGGSIPEFLKQEASGSSANLARSASAPVFKDVPASLDGSKTQTSTLLSWDGFSNDDVDQMYKEVVLGIPEDNYQPSATPVVEVDSFPRDGFIKPKYKDDIISSPSVKAVPVQISQMDTLKPEFKEEEEDISEDPIGEVSVPAIDLSSVEKEKDAIPQLKLPEEGDDKISNIEENIKKASPVIAAKYEDEDIKGNHSIIGPFASTDDAVSYFNSISSRLGFAYSHKILKSTDDGRYYIAIGKLSDKKISDKLCRAYSSDYISCEQTNHRSNPEEYVILKIKKVYSILGEFGSAEEAKLYFSKNIAGSNVNYKVAKAGSSDIYLLQLGPLPDGGVAKKLCGEVTRSDQKCKITVK